MDLEFFEPPKKYSSAKLTVQRTGRLGFSKGAIDMLNIETRRLAKFGKDVNGDLFLVMSEVEDSQTFNISKAGEYFYINAKGLLDDMGIDYASKNTIIFDLFKTESKNIYGLRKRVIVK